MLNLTFVFVSDVTNQILVINSNTLFGGNYFLNVYAILSNTSVYSTMH